jgi:hypothetical protein
MWSKPAREPSVGGSPAGSPPARRRSALLPFLGATLGAIVVFVIAPHCVGWFSVPTGGIGTVTITKYPKGFDYFVVIALTIASAAGALALSARRPPTTGNRQPTTLRKRAILITTITVFVAMCIIHDHPYAFMDIFHEGEHLSPASVLLDGGRPYGDTFFLHGFATDGGLDALVLGSKPSAKKTRRLETLLDAAALAMLVPIAAALTATTGGLIAAVILSLCAIGAGVVPTFPYFRWMPLLIAVWALLRYQREQDQTPTTGNRQPTTLLFIAAISSSLGILWSLDIGICAVAATAIVILFYTRRVTLIALAAIAAPLVVLLVTRADLYHFFRDSFVIIPRSIDAIWSVPAKPIPSLSLLVHPVALWKWLASEDARYYLPPVFFGLLLALALRKRDMRIAIIAIFSILLFRTAAGRVSWSHTRFAIPLLGMAMVAFLFEPWIRRRPMTLWRYIALLTAALIGFRYFELLPNATLGAKMLAGWPARQRHEGLVPYPMARGRGIYTFPENAANLGALNDLSQRAGPGTIFDLSGERGLYYLLDRRPATRCPDLAMLSAPELGAEALRELNAHPPLFVILEEVNAFGSLGGVANRDRIPEIASWIDAHYPVKVRAGRYVVGFRK